MIVTVISVAAAWLALGFIFGWTTGGAAKLGNDDELRPEDVLATMRRLEQEAATFALDKQ